MPTQAPKELYSPQADYAAGTGSDEQSQAIRLLQMRQRLASLSDEARSIRSQVPGEFKPDVERIQQQMQRLGERLSELSGTAIWHSQAAEMASRASPPSQIPIDAEARISRAAPDEVILLGGPTQSESPWDEQSANALTRFYESGAAYFGSVTEAVVRAPAPAPQTQQASIEPAWLDKRFTEVAERIEKALAEIRPESSLLSIGRRFDQLEMRMASALKNVACREDIEDLRIAEEQIDEIGDQLDRLKRQLARLDTIDAHLGTLTAQLSDERLTRLLKTGGGDAAARLDAIQAQLNELASQLSQERLSEIVSQANLHASELEGLAAAAALKTAAHIADQQTNESHIREIGQVRGMLESFITERRSSDENNASMLETMQQAIVRVLDRIEALELAQKAVQAPAAVAPKQPAPPVSETYTQQPKAEPRAQAQPAGYAGTSYDDVPPAASSHFSAAPFDLNAAFATPPQRLDEPFGGSTSPDSLRHDFIADAHRAKLKAASRVGAPRETTAGIYMDEVPEASEPANAPAERPRRRSILGMRTIMTILTLLAAIPAALFFMPRTPADNSLSQEIEQFFPSEAPAGVHDDGSSGARDGAPSPDAEPPANGMRSGSTEQPNPESGEYRDAGNPDGKIQGRVDTAALPDGMLAPATVMRERVLQANGAAAAKDTAAAMLEGPAEMPAPTVGPYSLRLAAVQGDPSAQYEVAVRIGEGKGTAQDSKEAALWYLRSATSGFAIAQFKVGTLYERGLGVEKNIDEAQAWYTRAAEQGNVKAMHNLAVLIASNSGPSPDYETASKWFAEAAERGLADSQFNLAVLLENGLGMPKDLKQAYKWLSLAANAGDADAKGRLATLRALLSPADRAEAEVLIRSWKAKPVDPVANDSSIAGQAWQRAPRQQTSG